MAALLSFLWPGLGQLYTGRRRLAVVFALPAALVLLALIYQMRQGVFVFGARLLNSDFALGALVIVVLLGVWRVVAVAHAFVTGEALEARRTLERAALAALVAVIVVSHSAAGYMLWVTYEADSRVFAPRSDLIVSATPAPSLALGVTPEPTSTTTPEPTPAIGSRVTILFNGVDSSPSRGERLYDTIMVVSYDPKTNSVQMVSIPRDISNFPLYYGGTAPAWLRINALPTDVSKGFKSPDSPYPTLVKEAQYLVGVHIDYYAVMDLGGFVKMVDMVGGIDVNNPSAICDCAYDGWPGYDWMDGSPYGFYLPAGPQHLDGRHALAYVRSRHSAGQSDFTRQGRQQQVLVDLLHKMAQPGQLLNLPNLIDTLGSSVTTSFPADQVADYVAIGENVPSGNFKQVVLDGPYFWGYLGSGAACLNYNKVAVLSRELFGEDSLWWGKADPAPTCGTA
ncbi:MAG: LCP family protein [Candidatus Limnocylindrales bacterium]